MKKRALCILMTAAMAVLSACGSSSSGSSSAAQTSASGSAQESSAASSASLSALSSGTVSSKLSKVDMSKWQYNSDDDVYYQIGLSYCETPADSSYETMGFYVPGSYFKGTKNSDGSYTCTIDSSAKVGSYTAESAPIIVPVNTPGYAAMNAPTDYSSSFGYGSVSDYTGAGMIVAFAGCRGRDAGAPAGVTDLKAAIRYTRYNKGVIPGDMDSIFTEGMSGGGAQSAILGASGDSSLYDAYLKAVGAVTGVSDAVRGSMCWCPITNLDIADEAYEWNMGSTRTTLSDDEQKYSDGMAEAFASYINSLGLKDESGNALTLDKSSDGIYQSGSYYDYLMKVTETSLNNFLSDTTFPYTASSSSFGAMGGGAPSGGTRGMKPDAAASSSTGTEGESSTGTMSKPDIQAESGTAGGMQAQGGASDNISRSTAETASVSISGTYDTAQDYIDALNASTKWVTYDSASNTAKITSLADFTKAMKVASKGIGAFDQLDASQGENTLFGYGDGSGAHFDPILAKLVSGTDYESAFTTDLARKDSVGNTVDVRVSMYNPMYYMCSYYAGYKTSNVASCWRIRTGIGQSDTSLCTEVDLALAASAYSSKNSVDFATVWGLQHTTAERSGDYVANFVSWVNDCMAK